MSMKNPKAPPPLTDLGNGLALNAIMAIGMNEFTVSATMSLSRPETIHNFARFAGVLETAHQQGYELRGRELASAPAAQGDAMTEDFDTWWVREQKCPEHSLITENAARAAWRAAIAAKVPE